ncbi:MAG: hypothetical protein GY798_23705 [Hyphomicrobiales bacterium]|nr:hypothetical protein [Hyphomicrobiales bacterium]
MNHPRISRRQCDGASRRSRQSNSTGAALTRRIRGWLGLAAAATFAIPALATAEDKPVPAGLTCPQEIAGGELISVATAAVTPGVLGYCVYYLLGETDLESVTATLRVADADYDWEVAFKAPKIEKGGMNLIEEETRAMPFGDRERDALVVTLGGAEEGLGQITESFATLWVFDLGNGRVISLEEEYNNVSEEMRAPLRDALLRAQSGDG